MTDFKKKFEDLKVTIEARKLRKAKRYQEKQQEREEGEKEKLDRRLSIKLAAERKAFGKVLTPEERLMLEKSRERHGQEVKERIQRVKKGFATAGRTASSINTKAGRIADKLDDVLDDTFQKVPEQGFGRGQDIADKPKGRDYLMEYFGTGAPQTKSGKQGNFVRRRDPIVEMFAMGGRPQQDSKIPQRDVLKEMYAFRPTPTHGAKKPKRNALKMVGFGREGFGKGDDIGERQFGTLFKAPSSRAKKGKRRGGIYDDLLM